MSDALDPPAGASVSGAGPLTLLVPILLGVLAALFWTDLFVPSGPPLEPERVPPSEVAVFEAVDVEGWLRLRLAPLRADPARQSFESEALQRRRGWTEGELWRLTLQRAGDAAPIELSESLLAQVRVEDGQGNTLRLLDTASDGIERGNDPLSVLLTARSPGPVEPGAEVQLVLWGRRPGDGARLLGFGGSSDGLVSSVALEPTTLPRDDFPRYLARLGDAETVPDLAPGSVVGPPDGGE